MKRRITVNVVPGDDGVPDQVEIWVNPEGLQQLIGELQALSERNDHFHMFTPDWGSDELSNIAYKAGDVIVHHLKVMFRPDAWDRQYFPHVMDAE